MTLFLLFYLLIGALLVVKSKYTLLCNEMFYLGMFWLLIFGTYITSGVIYRKYAPSLVLYFYVMLCAIALVLGRRKGFNAQNNVFGNQITKISTWRYAILGLAGVCIFVFDLFRLNGIMLLMGDGTGKNNEYQISIIGAIGSLLIPILFVEGIYLVASKLKNENSFSVAGFLLLLGYSIPCILNNGRESLAYVFIALIAIYSYNIISQKKIKKKLNLKRLIIRILIISEIFLFVWLIYNISSDRFGSNEINSFLAKHDVSAETMGEAEEWGELDFLYYNILSYFSHQLSFLEFTLKEYDGPYLLGMFEFNIISRRLPDFLGLDYNLVYDNLERLYSQKGVSYSGAWNTILGSFICDFGRIGSIIMCYVMGFFLGKLRRKFEKTYDVRYAVLVAIICASSFSSIQLGPFYNTFVYGSYIWWMIIFMHNETVKLPLLKYGKR